MPSDSRWGKWAVLALIVTFTGAFKLKGGATFTLPVRVVHPTLTVSPRTPDAAFKRAPFEAVLLDNRGKVCHAAPLDQDLRGTFTGVRAGSYHIALRGPAGDIVDVLEGKSEITIDRNRELSVSEPHQIPEDLLAGADADSYYGVAQLSLKLPESTSGLTLEAVPQSKNFSDWKTELRPQAVRNSDGAQIDVPHHLLATCYIFTLKKGDTKLVTWKQFLAPTTMHLKLPNDPALDRVLYPELAATRSSPSSSAATPATIATGPSATATASTSATLLPSSSPLPAVVGMSEDQMSALVMRLNASQDWRSLEALAAQLRVDAKSNCALAIDLDTFHHLMASAEPPERALERHRRWVEAMPHSIAARLQVAEDYIAWAWQARGSGFSNTVTQEGQKLFEQRLSMAQEANGQARAMRGDEPYMYVQQMVLAILIDQDQIRSDAAFRHAVSSAPRWMTVYTTQAFYHLPRWRGEWGAVGQVADSALRAVPGEDGEAIYARVAERVMLAGDNPLSSEIGLRWQPTRNGIERLDAQHALHPPDFEAFAIMAKQADDKELARSMFARIDHPTRGIWQSQEAYNKTREWALH